MMLEYKTKWVDALRSGEYPQTSGRLRDDSGFCCLGVLCDIVIKEYPDRFEWVNNEQVDPNRIMRVQLRGNGSPMDQWGGLLPAPIGEIVGLHAEDPPVFVTSHPSVNYTLSGVNDGGWSFGEIAKMIEEQM